MSLRKPTKALPNMAEADIAIVRIAPESSFKNKAYDALKEAILKMDIYSTPEPVMLDERALSERLGVSRTPIREAIAMLEQDGFVKTVPRRGIMVVRRTKSEIVDMIRAWAALESMAARLITTTARKKDISALRDLQGFRQGPPARGSRRGIFQGEHRLPSGVDLAVGIAGAGRSHQRSLAARARLSATDHRAEGPHRDLAARASRHHRSAGSARHRARREARPRSHPWPCGLRRSPRPGTIHVALELATFTRRANHSPPKPKTAP